jgi:beta-galactosidase
MRKIQHLNFGWRYEEDFKEEYTSLEFKDDHFSIVDIPHTTKEVPFNNFDEKAYQTKSCYRKCVYIEQLKTGEQVYIKFEGVMAYAKVFCNGSFMGDHKGGYSAFRVNLTEAIAEDSENLVVVYVDSTERTDIPPFGHVIDYLAYGGIYREVQLEFVPEMHMEHVLVSHGSIQNHKTDLTVKICMSSNPASCGEQEFEFELLYNKKIVHQTSEKRHIAADAGLEEVFSFPVENIKLWDTEDPNLYKLKVSIRNGTEVSDQIISRFGFRNIRFETDGFYLNGRKLKIRGLNRHQSYPYVGYAMPKSAQYKDAEILKHELGLNAVRLSHYPQSRHFLDRCDELGLLVFEEVPGWQHIGDNVWQDVLLANTRGMILTDFNHPSIIIWGVRVNESQDNDDLYTKTNALARELDPGRPTGGVRCITKSSLLEDVYTFNDFSHTGKNPGLLRKSKVIKTKKPYLITEYNGHMFPTKKYDDEAHRLDQALRHLNVLEALYKDDLIAGGFGWCMFDYNTHKDFGSGDKICYHGVQDMFRIPKSAAYAYASQQNDTPIMHVASSFNIGEYAASLMRDVYVFTNCETIKFYKNGRFIKRFYPRKDLYPNLPNPPIVIDDFIGKLIEEDERFSKKDAKLVKYLLIQISKYGEHLGFRDKLRVLYLFLKYKINSLDAENLYTKYFGGWGGEATNYTIEGYIDNKCVKKIEKGHVFNPKLLLEIDDGELIEQETYDTTRIIIRLVDDKGNDITYANDALRVSTEGPVKLIGPETISLIGGSIGFWIRSMGKSGNAIVKVHSERFETEQLNITVRKQAEIIRR